MSASLAVRITLSWMMRAASSVESAWSTAPHAHSSICTKGGVSEAPTAAAPSDCSDFFVRRRIADCAAMRPDGLRHRHVALEAEPKEEVARRRALAIPENLAQYGVHAVEDGVHHVLVDLVTLLDRDLAVHRLGRVPSELLHLARVGGEQPRLVGLQVEPDHAKRLAHAHAGDGGQCLEDLAAHQLRRALQRCDDLGTRRARVRLHHLLDEIGRVPHDAEHERALEGEVAHALPGLVHVSEDVICLL
eukprot:4117191-Prymnesium_polylepis.1